MLNQTQANFSSSATKFNSSNASSKAFQYLQKKGNLQSNTSNQPAAGESERSNNHLIKRIASGRKHLGQGSSSQDPSSSQQQ